jgi:hypothetical protein
VVNTKIIKKENQGNSIIPTQIEVNKSIISRLFTTFSPEPDLIERKGLKVRYLWEDEIKPGENLEIKIQTNWLFPLFLIFFVIAIVVLIRKSTIRSVHMRKKVSFIRTKGGEFALKVNVLVSANKYVEKVTIVDRLPPLVKVFERFGSEQPSIVDAEGRRIKWEYEKLEAGEVRMLSYVIFSKVGVVGKFALPSAIAIYEKDGEVREAHSNRAFFVAEQKRA